MFYILLIYCKVEVGAPFTPSNLCLLWRLVFVLGAFYEVKNALQNAIVFHCDYTIGPEKKQC